MRPQGFLVVIQKPSDSVGTPNARYRGIDRLPPYSPTGSVPAALDDYVFGEYKDASGLIPDLSLAKDLLNRLNYRPNPMEIIYVIEHDSGNEAPPNFQFLGFDVAGETPFWSIVGDLPQNPRTDLILKTLNHNGLFDRAADAENYLQDYRANWLTDPDLKMSIWEIFLVK